MCEYGLMSPSAPQRAQRARTRMTSAERREQLIGVARELFSENTFEGTSVEEIAERAEVSKPVIYEHFGGKEGLYAVVVDREMRALETAIRTALTVPEQSFRETLERGAMAMLNYIEANPDGFRIISRDSSLTATSATYASILNDITTDVTEILTKPLEERGYNPLLGPIYAQGMVGMVAMAAQQWLDNRSLPKEELAAQVVNLLWNGLRNLQKDPKLVTLQNEPRAERKSEAFAVGEADDPEPQGRRRGRRAEPSN